VGGIGIEFREQLANQQKQIDQQGHLHDPPQRQQGVVADVVRSVPPHNLQRQDDERGTGRKRAGQETGRDDRRIPKRTAAQADVQEGRDRVNAHRPGDRHKHERHVKHGRRLPPAIGAVNQVPADVQIQQQIAVQRNHVPGEHRHGKVEPQEQVHEAVRTPQVHGHKQEAHQDHRNGQQFAENDHVVQV